MKYLVLLFIFVSVSFVMAQGQSDSNFLFCGYVLDSDSVPVDGAYVLNCRNLKMVSVDGDGAFCFRLQKDDSLVIVHISYDRKFIHANRKKAVDNIFILNLHPHELGEVLVKNYEFELANFERNMKIMYKQMGLIEKPVDYKTGSSPNTINPYAPGANSPGFGINLLDLYKQIFRKKKRR